MPGKRESLRQGKAVELEPGIQGRLNFQDRTLELSDGRKLAISDKDRRALFPENEETKKHAQKVEEVERNVKQTPFGEFFHQIGQQGPIGGLKDIGDKLTHTGDEYLRLKKAEREVGQRISEESPWTSRGAGAASFLGDVALTKGMSAAKAAPLLTGLSAGSRVFEEPLQVAGEAAVSSAGGKLLDIGTNYLGKIASRRGAARDLPAQREAIRSQNASAQASIEGENAQKLQAFNALKQRASNENDAILHQHNLALNERQNKMVEAKRIYENDKAKRAEEIFAKENQYKTAQAEGRADAARLQNEYKQAKATAKQENLRLNEEYQLAQKQYEESLKDLPRLQKEAQLEYSKNVIKNVEDIQKAFPKDSKILGSQIGVQGFIDDSINKTGLAGSREGAQASRILKSLFPEGEFFTAKELSKRYQAVEEAIQRASPEVQGILSNFKNHLGEKLPVILEDTIAYSKIIPSLEKKLEKDIHSILNDIEFGRGETSTRSILAKTASVNLKQLMKQISPADFTRKLQSGEISQLLRDGILTSEDFLTDAGLANFAKLRKQGTYDIAARTLNEKHAYFTNQIASKIDNAIARNELKAMQSGREASKKLGKSVQKTYGLAEPVEAPLPPQAPQTAPLPESPVKPIPLSRPNLPPPIAPPQETPLPLKPPSVAQPSPYSPQSFTPQPEPILPPSQNFAERAGDFLEKPILKGKGTTNNLLKLGALKYALGPAALPLEATALGTLGAAKLLTSPGAAGQASRLSFRQAGIQAIESLAQKYPSYRNGVLDNPQERRSLTKEIEDDPEIPLEQKAILQSKINRGKPLYERL